MKKITKRVLSFVLAMIMTAMCFAGVTAVVSAEDEIKIELPHGYYSLSEVVFNFDGDDSFANPFNKPSQHAETTTRATDVGKTKNGSVHFTAQGTWSFNTREFMEKGKAYFISCYIKGTGNFQLSLEGKDQSVVKSDTYTASADAWKPCTLAVLNAPELIDATNGYKISAKAIGEDSIDLYMDDLTIMEISNDTEHAKEEGGYYKFTSVREDVNGYAALYFDGPNVSGGKFPRMDLNTEYAVSFDMWTNDATVTLTFDKEGSGGKISSFSEANKWKHITFDFSTNSGNDTIRFITSGRIFYVGTVLLIDNIVITKKATGEVIVNADFETEQSWRFATDKNTMTGEWVQPAKLTRANGGYLRYSKAADAQSGYLGYQKNVALKTNTDYTVTFNAYSSKQVTLLFDCKDKNEKWYNGSGITKGVGIVANSWKEYYFVYNAPADSVPDLTAFRLYVDNTRDYYVLVDDLKITDPDGKVVYYKDFDSENPSVSGDLSWIPYDITKLPETKDGGYIAFEIDQPSVARYACYNLKFTMNEGDQFTVEFDMLANNKSITLNFDDGYGNGYPDNMVDGGSLSAHVDVCGKWEHKTIKYICTRKGGSTIPRFYYNYNTSSNPGVGTALIDNVVVKDKDDNVVSSMSSGKPVCPLDLNFNSLDGTGTSFANESVGTRWVAPTDIMNLPETKDGGFLKFTIGAPGSNYYNYAEYRFGFKMLNGTTYTIEYDMMTSNTSVGFTIDAGYGGGGQTEIDPVAKQTYTWQHKKYTYDCTEDSDFGRIYFNIPYNPNLVGTVVLVDNIVVRDQSGNEIFTKSKSFNVAPASTQYAEWIPSTVEYDKLLGIENKGYVSLDIPSQNDTKGYAEIQAKSLDLKKDVPYTIHYKRLNYTAGTDIWLGFEQWATSLPASSPKNAVNTYKEGDSGWCYHDGKSVTLTMAGDWIDVSHTITAIADGNAIRLYANPTKNDLCKILIDDLWIEDSQGNEIFSTDFNCKENFTLGGNATWHKYNCLDDHDYGSNTCQVAFCTNCGKLIPAVHMFTEPDHNEEGHFTRCFLCDAIEEETVEKHVYDHAYDIDCNDCGATRTVGTCGDVDGNGEVNVSDYMELARNIVEMPTLGVFHEENADIDGDGKYDISDYMAFSRFMAEFCSTENLPNRDFAAPTKPEVKPEEKFYPETEDKTTQAEHEKIANWFIDKVNDKSLIHATIGNDDEAKVRDRLTQDVKKSTDSEGNTKVVATYYDATSEIEFTLTGTVYKNSPSIDYVVTAKNTGTETSPAIKDFYVINDTFELNGTSFTLNTNQGSNQGSEQKGLDDFTPVQKELTTSYTEFNSIHGTSSVNNFPFYDIIGGGQGLIMAIGWSGDWSSGFKKGENNVSIKAKQQNLNTVLLAGEEIRTPSFVMTYFEGNEEYGHNVWRKLILDHYTPDNDEENTFVSPISIDVWGETPASEMIKVIQAAVDNEIKADIFWVDSGWYDPIDHNDSTDAWHKHLGAWTENEALFPNGLNEVFEYAHEHPGMKTMLWWMIEDARAAVKDEWIFEEENYYSNGAGDYMLALDKESTYNTVLSYFMDYIEEKDLDCIRLDKSTILSDGWALEDERRADVEAPGLSRRGITENKYIVNFYSLWDALIKKYPGFMLDNTCSGGRRIDIEITKRSIPLWRTDSNSDLESQQAMTQYLAKWIPLSGIGIPSGTNKYNTRSYLSSSTALSLTSNNKFDESKIAATKAIFDEFSDLRPYWYGSYYQILDPDRAKDTWQAYELYRDDRQKGILVVIRRDSETTKKTIKLEGLEENGIYSVTNIDEPADVIVRTGKELMESGLDIVLPNAKTINIYQITNLI